MRSVVVLGLAVVVLTAASAVVVGHSNALSVDSQVSDDGTLVVESGVASIPGYVVVHENGTTDDLGAVLGYVELDAGDGFRQEMPIEIANETWRDWGPNRTVAVAFHDEQTGYGFDPADDPVMEDDFGNPIVERIVVGKAANATGVYNDQFEVPQELTSDDVLLREVTLHADGRVVVRVDDASGRVLGTRSLDAGTHENVTVPIDDAAFAGDDRVRTLFAHVSVSDGPNATALFRVGGEPVGTSFTVERVGPLNVTGTATPVADATGTGTGTVIDTGTAGTDATTPTQTGTDEPLVVTPVPTTASTTTDRSTEADRGTETDRETETATMVDASMSTSTSTTGANGHGFGVQTVVLPAVLAVLVVYSRVRLLGRS